jgi:SNF2 family DNA or RNA helicase
MKLFQLINNNNNNNEITLYFLCFQWENNEPSMQVVDVVIDPHIAQHLRPHQREGVIFLYECVVGLRSFNGNGAVLG